jgi:hypothetical protein
MQGHSDRTIGHTLDREVANIFLAQLSKTFCEKKADQVIIFSDIARNVLNVRAVRKIYSW